jgi:serine/threonine-protein kinase
MIASAGSRSSSRIPVLNKYEVLDELGHGGMATVYRAHDKRLARDVALKVLHPHLRESTEIAHRFAVEAKAVAKLRHANIVEVYDVSSGDEGEQYLVVELVRGPTLRKILQKHEGGLPPEIGAAIVMELLSGIAHAHAAGVIHRDVKPENVLIEHRPVTSGPTSGTAETDRGDRVAVKLTDFGIAKLLDAQGVTSTGQVLGSPAHMAPEQIEGGDVDGRADIFGIGVLLYECVVGHLPFLGNNPAQVLRRVLDGVYGHAERERPVVGKRWSTIIDRALARKPEDRYPDAGAMREAIATELTRLGMGPPRAEIEAWLDDPDGWRTSHDAQLIDRLCRLGALERKKSDTIGAAADYNRALAYKPDDPALLRVVASMQRSEARRQMVRKVAPLVLGACVLAPGTYFVVRALKNEAVTTTKPDPTVSVPIASIPTTPKTVTPPNSVALPPASVTAAHPVAMPTVQPTSNKNVSRTVTFTRVRPTFGVHMTLDGVPMSDPAQNQNFVIPDDKPHQAVFTCTNDLCPPKTIPIASGDGPVDLDVTLTIPPAKLVVEGDPAHTYALAEDPNRPIAPGEEFLVPMIESGQRTVHVFDRNDSTRPAQVVTLTTGKRASVSFKK